MAKGQMRSNRETKKPKQDKPNKQGASYLSTSTLKPVSLPKAPSGKK